MSITPKRPRALATISSIDSSRARSASIVERLAPCCCSCAVWASSARPWAVRSTAATLISLLSRLSTSSRPMPPAAPVTIATRCCSLIIASLCSSHDGATRGHAAQDNCTHAAPPSAPTFPRTQSADRVGRPYAPCLHRTTTNGDVHGAWPDEMSHEGGPQLAGPALRQIEECEAPSWGSDLPPALWPFGGPIGPARVNTVIPIEVRLPPKADLSKNSLSMLLSATSEALARLRASDLTA